MKYDKHSRLKASLGCY